MTLSSDSEVMTKSSGNVFDDLGLPESTVLMAKAELAMAISRIISDKGWSQEVAANKMAIDQPKVSLITRGHLEGFSLERLMRLLNSLDFAVDLTVRPALREEKAGIGVEVLGFASR